MTHAELTAAVRGSLLMEEQRDHRHDAPARRTQLVRDTNAQPSPRGGERVGSRVHAPGSEEAGCDGCSPAPTTKACPTCKGTGEIRRTGQSLHPSAGVYVDDPQAEEAYECPTCAGTGSVPVPRVIPGSKRAM